nr:divergent polysaccharide deacetylase family protein [Aquicoccus sp. G2-2]MEA1113344.1 divergent polysaccharide deacetylase family protein [Aquicoccus sp. G2-2]
MGVAKPSATLPRVTEGVPGKQSKSAASEGTKPPLKRYAAPVQDTGGKPEMSVVLIDQGTGPVGVEALAGFPYPLSIAVDTSRSDAEDTMAKYRAAGFEVLAMIKLPDGAQPEDVEVAMPVLMAKVPEAVAVMEAPGLGIQFDRKVSDQVTRILADTGQGLLLYPKGLDTARKLATKNGVPAATVFRDLDDKGQDARAIRRFLNFGTVKASDGEGVVMVGRMRADTLSALILWALEDKTRQVAIVPLSQQLLGE